MRSGQVGGGMVAVLLVSGAVAWAGRPLAVDDADPGDPGQFEFEAGVGYVHDPQCEHWDLPVGVACGLGAGVEAGVACGGQFEERTEFLEADGGETCEREHGLGDLVVGGKWQFTGERDWWPRQALAPAVKFPTADDGDGLGSGETDYDLVWIASKSFARSVGAHVNAGYSWIGAPPGEDASDVLHYGLALDLQISGPLQCVGEVVVERECRSGSASVARYAFGIRWAPLDGVAVDAAAGAGFGGEAPDFTATAGVTVALGGRTVTGP